MAQTPWGELTVSDAHVHFFSRNFYAGLSRQKKLDSVDALAPLLGWDVPASGSFGLATKCVADCVVSYPGRFFGYFMLDPLQADARDRVAAAARNPHLHCMCLFPAMHT